MFVALTRESRQNFLTVINHICPTGREQQAFVHMVHNLEKDGASDRDITRALVSALADGVLYGNWPAGR